MQEKERALRLIDVLRGELNRTFSEMRELGTLLPVSAFTSQALRPWKARAIREISEHISSTEARNLEACGADDLAYINSSRDLWKQVKMYDEFLEELAATIEHYPEGVLDMASPDSSSEEREMAVRSPQKNVVFIVHGHDEPNLNKLKELLKGRYGLTTIVLSSQPEGGRTIIEKFEDEAQKAVFAFVLLTPDDFIQNSAEEYSQARPNVIFELGWFYGRLGRSKVCILYKRGTKIHSDLEGIGRIEFTKDVDEKVINIERELKAGGLLNP